MSDHAPTVNTTTYVINNVTYVPHFRNVNVFVGPGYPRSNRRLYTSDELLAAGATAVPKFLWSRGEHGNITAANP
jgi:hypothetical protein